MPNSDPVANGRQLMQAFAVAVQSGRLHDDYYANCEHPARDNGYLRMLVGVCRGALAPLPSYPMVSSQLLRVSKRIETYQASTTATRWALTTPSPMGGTRSHTPSGQRRRPGPVLVGGDGLCAHRRSYRLGNTTKAGQRDRPRVLPVDRRSELAARQSDRPCRGRRPGETRPTRLLRLGRATCRASGTDRR